MFQERFVVDSPSGAARNTPSLFTKSTRTKLQIISWFKDRAWKEIRDSERWRYAIGSLQSQVVLKFWKHCWPTSQLFHASLSFLQLQLLNSRACGVFVAKRWPQILRIKPIEWTWTFNAPNQISSNRKLEIAWQLVSKRVASKSHSIYTFGCLSFVSKEHVRRVGTTFVRSFCLGLIVLRVVVSCLLNMLELRNPWWLKTLGSWRWAAIWNEDDDRSA